MGHTETRQLYDITLADLREHPRWVLLSEDDPNAIDEWTLRPCEPEMTDSDQPSIVHADFTLADGSHFEGFVFPDRELAVSQPCLLVEDRRITFWSGMIKPAPSYLQHVYEILGSHPPRVFPITWKSKCSAYQGTTIGKIEGFGYVEDGQIRWAS